MSDDIDRAELERRLAQARRLASNAIDSLTKARLENLIRDLEGQLRSQK